VIPNSPFRALFPTESQRKEQNPQIFPASYLDMADALKAEGNKAIAEKNFDEAM
jgi:hypothetical protein